MNPDTVLRAAVGGASTGGRTFTGLATLAATTAPEADTQPDLTLGKTWVKVVIGAVALQELVMDKLPQTPSRTDWPPLAGRLVAATLAGALIGARFGGQPTSGDPVTPEPMVDAQNAQRERRNNALTAGAVAAGAALSTSLLGPRFRAFCANRFGRDWIGAALEDLLVMGLAAVAARPQGEPAQHADVSRG